MKQTRKITKEKQDEREEQIAWEDLRSLAYKFSSMAYSMNKKGRLKLKKFNGDARKVTNEINNLFECELVSPNEIRTCVKDNRVGQSPPRRGKPPIIPVDVFKRICWLVDMAC